MEGISVTALAELLKAPEENSDSDGDGPSSSVMRMGPGDVGPAKKDTANADKTCKTRLREHGKKTQNTKDIWTEEEIQEGAELDDVYDGRPQPEYEIIYKQAVTSEDMFLQMGGKTPTTASCEDMIVRIKLPSTKLTDVELDVKPTYLDCRTKLYKLGLYLPHRVDHKSGTAHWNGNQETLEVTLRITRELDFMNF